MKNIFKNFVALGALAMLTVSCNDDSSRFVTPPTLDTITATITSPKTSSFSGEYLPVEISLPQSFSTAGKVQVTATTSDGNVARTTIDVPAGVNSVSGKVDMPVSSIDYALYSPTVVVGTVKVTGIDLGTDNNGTYNLESNALELPYNSFYSSLRSDGINVSLDWTVANADIDWVAFGPNTRLNSRSGARPENDSDDNDELPDGNYRVVYRSYSNVTGPIQIRVIVRSNNDSGVFTVDLPNLPPTGGWFGSNTIATLTKTTTQVNGDDVVTWTFAQ